MKKRYRKEMTNKQKKNTESENDIFKKYAAPRSENFLYFDKLQKDYYLQNTNE